MNSNGKLTLPTHNPLTVSNTNSILNGLPIIQETPPVKVVNLFSDYMNRIRNEPDPVKIMGNFVYARELTLLAGMTNVGKSTLAFQIALSVSTGKPCLDMKNDLQPCRVLIYDFESKPHQLKKRYGNFDFTDNKNLLFCNDTILLDDASTLFANIESHINLYKPELIIIDNMGILNEQPTVDQQAALKVMKALQRLCKMYEIGIIVVCHTVKIKEFRPLTVYDIEGSGKIVNYADAAFFINKTKDSEQRYLKQVKARNSSLPDEVTIIETCIDNYFHFEYFGTDTENNILPKETDVVKQSESIDLEMVKDIVGTGIMPADFVYKYQNRLGKSERTAQRFRNKLIDKGILIKHPDGKLILNTEMIEADEGF